MGWWANKAPLGYRNDKENSTIVVDPVPFAIIRRMWELFLTGTYSVPQLQRMANEEWGFRTPIRKNSGGRKLARSAAYRIFSVRRPTRGQNRKERRILSLLRSAAPRRPRRASRRTARRRRIRSNFCQY